MPEAVKISELPVMSTVQAGDILPVVDSQLTQTGRATAAQVAAIGGGPPGDNTVSTVKMQDNAVTAAKCSFTAPDKLFSRTAAGAGSGVEIACTPYARGLLASADSSAALAHLGNLLTLSNTTFSGTSTFTGSAVLNGGATISSGLTASGGATVNGGLTVASGNLSIAGTTTSQGLPAFYCRAYVVWNGVGGFTAIGSGNVTSVTRHGLGDYTVNFATPLPLGYAVQVASEVPVNTISSTGCFASVAGAVRTTYSTSAVAIAFFNPQNSADRGDAGRAMVCCFA